MNTIEDGINNTLKKTPQFTRLKRHASTIWTHSTPKKLFNLLKIEVQRKLGVKKINGFPYIIIIDPINTCNLKCPLCPTGLGEKNQTKGRLNLEEFKNHLKPFIPYAYEVILHNWGEPFLNNNILSMVSHCKTNNIGTNLSSNLNVLSFSGEEIVKSGLEYLIVSLDGTSQETYKKYRVNGDISTVFKNLNSILEAKKKLKSKTPVIEWQYLVMKHNLHEINEAKKLSVNMGVDLLRFIPVGLPFDSKNKKELINKWYPYSPPVSDGTYIDDRFLQKPIKGGCFYLYRSATITVTGKLTPCCAVWKNGDEFGDIKLTDFTDIWNNNSYRNARALFSSSQLNTDKKTTCCDRCSLFEKQF